MKRGLGERERELSLISLEWTVSRFSITAAPPPRYDLRAKRLTYLKGKKRKNPHFFLRRNTIEIEKTVPNVFILQ